MLDLARGRSTTHDTESTGRLIVCAGDLADELVACRGPSMAWRRDGPHVPALPGDGGQPVLEVDVLEPEAGELTAANAVSHIIRRIAVSRRSTYSLGRLQQLAEVADGMTGTGESGTRGGFIRSIGEPLSCVN